MATYVGKDVGKMKAKGGGKWKYMPEKDMLEIAAKFAPYRCVVVITRPRVYLLTHPPKIRSLFMWYMWKIQNVDVEAMQK